MPLILLMPATIPPFFLNPILSVISGSSAGLELRGTHGVSGGVTVAMGGTTYMSFNSNAGSEHITVSKEFSPSADNSISLGASDERWSAVYAMNVYTGDLHLKNDRGAWSVIEESNYLTIRHNESGKRFKLLMEELSEGEFGPGLDGR